MTAIVITPSTDRRGSARSPRSARGASPSVVVTLDAAAFDRVDRAERAQAGETRRRRSIRSLEEQRAQRARALRHALAEYELKVHNVLPGQALARGPHRMMSGRSPRCGARAEGWLSLALVAVLAVSVAWSLDDAGWVLGQRDLDRLPARGRRSAVSPPGSSASKVGWNRPVAHLDRSRVRGADRPDPRR